MYRPFVCLFRLGVSLRSLFLFRLYLVPRDDLRFALSKLEVSRRPRFRARGRNRIADFRGLQCWPMQLLLLEEAPAPLSSLSFDLPPGTGREQAGSCRRLRRHRMPGGLCRRGQAHTLRGRHWRQLTVLHREHPGELIVCLAASADAAGIEVYERRPEVGYKPSRHAAPEPGGRLCSRGTLRNVEVLACPSVVLAWARHARGRRRSWVGGGGA